MQGAFRRSRGLTLVELLVSMVIMGFVMTLVSQAVFQVGLVVRVADESVVRLGERWRAGWSLAPVFGGLVAPLEGGTSPLVGTERRLDGFTTVSLLGDEVGVQPIALLLRPDGRGGTEMIYRPDAHVDEQRVVAHWPGRIEFRYRSVRAEEVAQWPPWTRSARAEPALLPEMVQLVVVGSGEIAMAYQVSAPADRQAPPGADPFSGRAGQ